MVRANDGNQWGNYTTFTISPKANAAPPAGTSTVLDLEQTATGVYDYFDIGESSIMHAGPLTQISTSLSVVGIGGFDGRIRRFVCPQCLDRRVDDLRCQQQQRDAQPPWVRWGLNGRSRALAISLEIPASPTC